MKKKKKNGNEDAGIVNLKVLGGSQAPFPLPRVFISQEAIQRIKCFVDLCEYEINGFGFVERNGNDFVITDVFLIKQYTCTSGVHVETDSRALNKFVRELVQNNGDASKMRLQWHSHAWSSVFFSDEDVETIGNYMNDFMISLVMNKYGEYRCRLDLFKPFNLSLEVPLLVYINPLPDAFVRCCEEEMKQNVRVKTPILGKLFTRVPKISDDTLCGIPVDLADVKASGPEEIELLSQPNQSCADGTAVEIKPARREGGDNGL